MPDLGFNPISSGIGAAVGLAQTVTGIVNNKKLKKEEKELERTRPKYQVSELVQQDLDQAESEVGGLSSRAMTAYNLLQDKQFSSSIGAILRGGGSVNNVADVYSESDEGRQRLALLNDQFRANQIQNLSRRRDRMLEETDKAFLYNIDAPWKDKARRVAKGREEAQRDIWGGLKTIGGIAMQAGADYYNNKRYNDYYNNSFGTFDEPVEPSARTTYYEADANAEYGDFENPFENERSFLTQPSTKPTDFPMYR